MSSNKLCALLAFFLIGCSGGNQVNTQPYSYNSSVMGATQLTALADSATVFDEQFLPNRGVVSLSRQIFSVVEVRKTNGEIISPSLYSVASGNLVLAPAMQAREPSAKQPRASN